MFDATITSATIMVLFGAANTFGRILTMNSVPTMVTQWMLSVTSSKALIMLMINIALLIIGMFLDTISSIVLFGPIFAPIAIAIGYDPLHFGIIMVINLWHWHDHTANGRQPVCSTKGFQHNFRGDF